MLCAKHSQPSIKRPTVALLTLSVWFSISATALHAQELVRVCEPFRDERPEGQLPSPQSSAGARAQAGNEQESHSELHWFPDSLLVIPLRAAPREIRTAAGPLAVDRDGGTQFGTFEVAADLGFRLQFVRILPRNHRWLGLDVGLETGVFTRFSPESTSLGLLETDWRVGVPLSLQSPGWDVRLGWVHVSSHLGDDFLSEIPDAPIIRNSSKDGFELLLARRFDQLRLYTGGDWNYQVTPNVETFAGRVGLELTPSEPGGSRVQPHFAVNLEITDLTSRLAVTGEAGVRFRMRTVALSLSVIAHSGPSPMGHFRTVDEQSIGVTVSVIPINQVNPAVLPSVTASQLTEHPTMSGYVHGPRRHPSSPRGQ
jgi:hypothetical protein